MNTMDETINSAIQKGIPIYCFVDSEQTFAKVATHPNARAVSFVILNSKYKYQDQNRPYGYTAEAIKNMSRRFDAIDWLIEDLTTQDIQTWLYLDVDITLNGDATCIFNEQLPANAISGVIEITDSFNDFIASSPVHVAFLERHLKSYQNEYRRREQYKPLNRYINSGVLIFQVDKLKQTTQDIVLDFRDHLTKYDYQLPDQDYINHRFDVGYLNRKWNFMAGHDSNLLTVTEQKRMTDKELVDNVVFHWHGGCKPWIYPKKDSSLYRQMPVDLLIKAVNRDRMLFSEQFMNNMLNGVMND